MSKEETKRTPYILGEQFVDNMGRSFEIVETYWDSIRDGKPIVTATVETVDGHKMHFADIPDETELKRVGIRQLHPACETVIIRAVEQLQRAEAANAIRFIY